MLRTQYKLPTIGRLARRSFLIKPSQISRLSMGYKRSSGGREQARLRLAANQLKRARRVLVLGSSGSGKSTLTAELSTLLDLEPIYLDAHFWKVGWIRTSPGEWEARVKTLIERPQWIMDGTYEGTLPLRLPAADTIITIEDWRVVCLYRVLKRKLTVDDKNRPDAPPGQKIDRAFLKYIWRYPTLTRPYVYRCVEDSDRSQNLIVLRGLRDASRLLQQLKAET